MARLSVVKKNENKQGSSLEPVLVAVAIIVIIFGLLGFS